MAEHAPQNSVLYRGLDWTDIKTGGRQAMSDTTDGRYSVTLSSETIWSVKFGWPKKPGAPHIVIGQYADNETARVAAERHDFTYWSSTIVRGGGTPIFIGSGDEGDLVSKLGTDSEEITKLLIETSERETGKIFAHAASFFPAIKTALKQDKGGRMTITLSVLPNDLPRWFLESDLNSQVLLGAIELDSPKDEDWTERGQRALRRAFALPLDNSFQNWMLHRYDRWKLIATAVTDGTTDEVEKATTETMMRLLACPSRSNLLRDRDAIEKIEQLDKEFYMDLSRGFGRIES
jgi:hypothetical protein